MDPYSMFGVQEYSSRKTITGEPSKEKEPSQQYSPRITPSLPASPRDSPTQISDYKKRKRGRPPLEKDSRLCTNCGTAETPEWRKGPLGPHTLCNACGLQWMKAQKRENENRSKVEEARKKNSVMRVVISRREQGDSTRAGSHGLVEMNDNTGEFSSKYSPEMDTLPPDAVSPSISPMHQTPNSPPLTIDALNTLKAIQTLSTLSQMNQMNHYNTLNHLSMLHMGSNTNNNNNTTDNTLHSPPPQYTHTVINHFNTNLNTFNTNSYTLSSELATPMARYPTQQVFLPVAYGQPMSPPPPPPANPYTAYMPQVPVKDYTSTNMHFSASPQYPHYPPQVHNTHIHSHPHTSTSILHPSPHTLIPNPMVTMHQQQYDNSPEQYEDPDEASITGGGQM
eukprot:Phypoly_transcript_09221.p1 GENE.Phypoly_transcript_09221~~Phypoly_transcript_09221.p1  ORF type:complete len:422 (+),score=64.54 Phypoly_transcript_09221:86-1267(+)